MRGELEEAQPENLPEQTIEAARSQRRLLTELESREGILDRRFYAVCEEEHAQELRGLLARSGLSIHPLKDEALQRLVIASALGGSPARTGREEPVEVMLNQRQIRLGERLARSLHLAKWPRSLAPGFLQQLMATGAPMDIALHLGPIPSEQAARQLEWQKVRFESARSLSLRRGKTMSPEAEIALEDVSRLRDDVQRGRERLFHASLSLTLHADDAETLDELTQRASAHFAAALGQLDPCPSASARACSRPSRWRSTRSPPGARWTPPRSPAASRSVRPTSTLARARSTGSTCAPARPLSTTPGTART